MNVGKELTVVQAREIAVNGGIAWCVMNYHEDRFDGPVFFEPSTVGHIYYIHPVKDDNDGFFLMDIDFRKFDEDPRETAYVEWNGGDLTLYEVLAP